MRSALLILIILLASWSCKKDCEEPDCFEPTDPSCVNYDPCHGHTEVSAAFVIEEYMGNDLPDSIIYYNAESLIFTRRVLRFRALEEDGFNYTWYLGTEVVNEMSFSRQFDESVPFGTEITISLVIEKVPDLECFPLDDGIDSLAKTFTIVDYCDLPIVGKFKGLFHEAPVSAGGITIPLDSTIIEISFTDFSDGSCGNSEALINFGGIQDTLYASPVRLAADFLYFVGSGSASPFGFAEVDQESNIIVMDYDYYSSSYQFTGKRIQ